MDLANMKAQAMCWRVCMDLVANIEVQAMCS